MSNLLVKQPTLDSREVAKMVGKDHPHLLRDIKIYIEYMNNSTNPKLDSLDFFIRSTYIDNKGEERPNYRVTKKGCEFIAHKLTGQKGTTFTATYINKFHDMEQQLQTSKYKLPMTYKEALLQLVESVEEKEKLTLANKQKDQLIGELKPKADYMDSILKNKGLVTITQIAKDYGMSGTKMNDLLHELGIQFKQSGQWLLYTKYHDKGYTHSETIPITHSDGRPDVRMNTKWTQKGRLFLYDLLKEHGTLPVIEQVIEEIAN